MDTLVSLSFCYWGYPSRDGGLFVDIVEEIQI